MFCYNIVRVFDCFKTLESSPFLVATKENSLGSNSCPANK